MANTVPKYVPIYNAGTVVHNNHTAYCTCSKSVSSDA